METTTTLPAPAEQWLTLTGEDLPKEAGQLPAEKVATLAGMFAPFMQQVVELRSMALDIEVTDEGDADGMAEARRLRLAIRNLRVEADKVRKQEKEYSLITGRVVDWFGRSVRELAEVTENHLKDQETYAERMEAERRAKLKTEREEALAPYIEEGMTFSALDTMDESEFQSLLDNTKTAHAYRVKQAQEEAAARQAQAKAEAEERERLRAENERLRAEAAEREHAEREQREADAAKARQEVEKLRKQEEAMLAEARGNAHEKARYDLWKFISERFGMSLDESEMIELVQAVERYQKTIQGIG